VRGMLTTKGKVRSSVESLAKFIDRFDKLAKQLGLERKARKITTIDDVLNSDDPIDVHGTHEPEDDV
jgi:hypothetical protein